MEQATAEPGRRRPPGCSALSRAAGEPLHATAPHATEWLLLEVRGAWKRDVASGEGLDPRARAAVLAWREGGAQDSRRVLYVRRPGRSTGALLAFLVAAGEERRAVRRLELSGHDELEGLDLEAAGEPLGSSLVLVCAHGSRDRCCAAAGAATFRTLEPMLREDELWLSSHQGGHRFAANVLVLPAGIQLGRLDPILAREVVARAIEGEIDLDRYRGRTCYPPPVQAAELAIRAATGATRLDALQLLRRDVEAGTVCFREPSGREHVAVVETTTGPAVPASCGATPEPQPRFSARVLP